MSHWYVIQTAPQREFSAAEALRERGYVVYVPVLTTARRASRHARRRRLCKSPLFPRYIFTHMMIPWREMRYDDPSCLRDRRGRRLLTGLLTVAGAAEPIEETVIGKIADMAREMSHARAPRVRRLMVGDIGVLKSGPLEGQRGEVVAVRRDEAEIAIRLLGAVRRVRARLESVAAA